MSADVRTEAVLLFEADPRDHHGPRHPAQKWLPLQRVLPASPRLWLGARPSWPAGRCSKMPDAASAAGEPAVAVGGLAHRLSFSVLGVAVAACCCRRARCCGWGRDIAFSLLLLGVICQGWKPVVSLMPPSLCRGRRARCCGGGWFSDLAAPARLIVQRCEAPRAGSFRSIPDFLD
mgnify:CR=1 FL=1